MYAHIADFAFTEDISITAQYIVFIPANISNGSYIILQYTVA
jgi:hypothetical protein